MESKDKKAQGKRIRQLSLAVSLRDGYSGGRPLGAVELFIEGYDRPTLNPSGYYTFLDLPAGRYHVLVNSENYMDEKVTVDIKAGSYSFEEIILTPKPCYPFSPGETLVRGTLRDASGPIAGASLKGSMHAGSFSSRTDANGEFVIFFGAMSEEDWKEIPISVEYRSPDGRPVEIVEMLNRVAVGVTNFMALEIAATAAAPVKGFEKVISVTTPQKKKYEERSYEKIPSHSLSDLTDIFEIEWEDIML